jgi:hypothetical protein
MHPIHRAAWPILLTLGCASPDDGDTGTEDSGDGLLDPDAQTPTTCGIDSSSTGSSQSTLVLDAGAQTVSCVSGPSADEGLVIAAYSGSDTWSFSTNVPLAEVRDCGGHEYYTSSYGQAAYEVWVSCDYVAAGGGERELTFRVVSVDVYTYEIQIFGGRAVAPDAG